MAIGRWTRDGQVVSSTPMQHALSGNNLGQVVHTNVPLFIKQYNLVPCEGLYA